MINFAVIGWIQKKLKIFWHIQPFNIQRRKISDFMGALIYWLSKQMLNNFLPKSRKKIAARKGKYIKRQPVKSETLTIELSQLYFYGQFLLSHIDIFSFFQTSRFVFFKKPWTSWKYFCDFTRLAIFIAWKVIFLMLFFFLVVLP